MNAAPGRWRRLAASLARHAARILPGARSPWADAMRRELDYIEDDPAAVRWALGCVLASYRTRLTQRARPSVRAAWRPAAIGGVVILFFGLALQENAGGQTAPPQPAFEETTCDLPDVSPEIRRPRCGARARHVVCRSDCADPLPAKLPEIQRDR
jgi:hypothetical protein